MIDLNAIKARCKALDERMGEGPWTLEESILCVGLFNVYDSDGNVISHGIEEKQAFIAHSRADVPALVAEVERLQRDLRDEQVRRGEWGKMYDQAVTSPAPDACLPEPDCERTRLRAYSLRQARSGRHRQALPCGNPTCEEEAKPEPAEMDPCEGCGNQGAIAYVGNDPGSGNDLCHACGIKGD